MTEQKPRMDQFIHQGARVRVAGEESSCRVLATWQGTVTLLEGSEDIVVKGIVVGTRYRTREVAANVCTVLSP